MLAQFLQEEIIGHYDAECFPISNITKPHSSKILNLHDVHYNNITPALIFLNTLRPRQNGRYFADDIFKCIFLNENAWILLKISLKFVRKVWINNIPALVQIMAWCRLGDKPLSEPMMVNLLTHICVTLPQWVKSLWPSDAIRWEICVNIGSGNGLMPDGIKPLPEPLLTYHQWGPLVFIAG